MKDYNRSNIPLAKELRKNMTKWERKLWYEFLRDYPIKFQRQKSIGNYIVDFYCAKAKLVIELDGMGHDLENQYRHDQKRTKDLQEMDLQILRIANIAVERDFKTVCERIHILVGKSLPQSATLTAPRQRGPKTNRKSVSLPLTREVAEQREVGGRDSLDMKQQNLLW